MLVAHIARVTSDRRKAHDSYSDFIQHATETLVVLNDLSLQCYRAHTRKNGVVEWHPME